MFNTLLAILELSLFIAGLSAILTWVLRHVGRAASSLLRPPPQYPHCAACHYDLRGVSCPDGAPLRCPECGAVQGASLTSAKGISRRGLLLGAGLIALASLTSAVGEVCEFNGRRYWLMPDRMVIERAIRFDHEAVDELEHRLLAGSISKPRGDALLTRGLSWQQRVSRGGSFDYYLGPADDSVRLSLTFGNETDWPRLLRAAIRAGYATPQQSDQFLRSAVTIDVFSLGPDSIAVQVISHLGQPPGATVNVREQSTPAARAGTDRALSATTWNWRFDFPAGFQGPAIIEYHVDFDQARADLGAEPNQLLGGIEIPIPGPRTPPGPQLLQSLRPFDPSH